VQCGRGEDGGALVDRHSIIIVTPGLGLNRINRRLIPTSYNFFSRSPSPKNSKVKCAWPEEI